MPEAEVKITVRPNGPFRVEGPIKLVDAEGREWNLEGKPAISLCRCGASTKNLFVMACIRRWASRLPSALLLPKKKQQPSRKGSNF